MSAIIISATVLLGFTLFLLLFFKANAGVLFLAACAGLVLLESLDPVVVSAAGAIVPKEGESYVRLLVIILSMTFAGMIFRHSISDRQLWLHTILAVVCAVMLWVLLPSSTGVSWLVDASETNQWRQVNDFRTIIVAAGFLLSLFSVVTQASHGKRSKAKHH